MYYFSLLKLLKVGVGVQQHIFVDLTGSATIFLNKGILHL
jgi:hypothetical protein